MFALSVGAWPAVAETRPGDPLTRGDSVRVSGQDLEPVTGSLVAMDARVITLRGPASLNTIDWAVVDQLERRYEGPDIQKGIRVGGIAGVSVGLVAVIASGNGSFDMGDVGPTVMLTAFAGFVGAALGAAFSHLHMVEQWETLPRLDTP